MVKFYNLSILAALFLSAFAISLEIAFSLSPTPSPKHEIPTSQHISQLAPKSALENPHSAHSIPKIDIVYPLSKPKVSPRPSPNKPLPSHLAPKSSIKQDISPQSRHTSNSILAPHSHVFSSKPIPHSTTKVTKPSPSKSKLAPRPAPRKYYPTQLAPKIPISKQSLSPKPSPKPTKNHGSKFFLVRPKVGSHVVSPQIAPITYKQKVNPKLAPKSTRKFSPNTQLAPKSTVTKPNSLLSPTSKIITKSRLASKDAPKLSHKLTPKHGTH